MMDFDEVREVLTPKSTSLDEKLSEFREDRDSWNAKVKKYLTHDGPRGGGGALNCNRLTVTLLCCCVAGAQSALHATL